MRGYPKHINTMADLQNAAEIDPARTKAMLQAALDSREGWIVTDSLEAESDGVTDDTHRVVNHGEDEPDWYQEAWGPLPGNLIDRLGVSVAEAQELIGG